MKGLGSFLILGLLGFEICSEPQPVVPSKTVVVLFDRSDSTQGGAVRDAYVAAFETVVKGIQPGDALVAGWITDHSASELELLANHDFRSAPIDAPNDLYADAERRKQAMEVEAGKADVLREAGEALRAHPRKVAWTDILGSIDLARRSFAAYARDARILVLASDMVHETPDLNLAHLNLTGDAIVRAIGDLRKTGRIVDLTGVRVYVVGAQASEDTKFRQVKAFWEAYFREAGAVVVDYGATLLKFP